MAGKIHKYLLFQHWAWLKHIPDWRTIRTFYPHFVTTKKDRRDDTCCWLVNELPATGSRSRRRQIFFRSYS